MNYVSESRDNRKIKYRDRTPEQKHSKVKAFTAAAAAAGAVASGYYFISKCNYRHNFKADAALPASTKNRIINDQNMLTGKKFRYGLYSAKHNACEAIAVHNVKVLRGQNSSLSETIKDFQKAAAMIGYGVFGSDPFSIGRVLKKSGIKYSAVNLSAVNKPGIYIISFWNKGAPWKGLHTVAVSYDGYAYITYNLKGKGQLSDEKPAVYAGKRYICGYYLR